MITNIANLKFFGAIGDNKTNDTKAFNRTVRHLERKGGGTLYVPKGVFLLKPDKTPLRLCSNLTITGEGVNSVLKVHDDTGDYWGLFGQVNRHENKIENFTARNIRIDQNPAGNKNVNITNARSDTEFYRQYVFTFRNFENIDIDNVIFSPTTGTNTITANNPQCRNAKVRNCVFSFERSNGNPEYDNSAIYLNCINHRAIDNDFYADISAKARACVESHQGHGIVRGNTSEGYYTGVNVVAARDPKPFSNQSVTDNVFTKCRAGIQLWIGDRGKMLGPLRNVTIANNTIQLTDDFKQSTIMGITDAGSFGEGYEMENVNITGNTIDFEGIEEEAPHLKSARGISLRLPMERRNMNITDNIIMNSPLGGIEIGTTSGGSNVNMVIKDNLLMNCGSWKEYAGSSSRKTYITVAGKTLQVKVKDNGIIDTFDELRGVYSIRVISGEFESVTVKDNDISSAQKILNPPMLHESVIT